MSDPLKSAPATVAKTNNVTTQDVAAGGGAGGLLIYAINHYVTDTQLNTFLLYCVPAAAVVLAGIWAKLRRLGEHYANVSLKRWQLSQAWEYLKSIESDPKATDDHKAMARADFEIAQRDYQNLLLKGI